MIRVIIWMAVLGVTGMKAAEPMNIIIVQTDEHNFRTLGCYRNLMSASQAYIWGDGVKVDTPNIDWLAERGAICDRFYATSPVCTPSRAALMTGRYPQNTGSITNDLPMLDEMETFAEVLQKAGYRTGYAGKWHLDGNSKPGWEPERKFGFEDNRFMFNRGHWKKLDLGESGPFVAAQDKKGVPGYGLDGADETTFTTDFLIDRTIEFVKSHRSGPFCYMVSIPDPHGPNTVRPPYDTMFDEFAFRQPASALASGSGLPSFASVMKDRFVARQMALYFGMVKCIDDNIGRLLKTLRDEALIENTMVIFTSDHGDMCGEHGRHNKGIPCEGSARIPFVMYAPGLVKPGTVLHEALGTVDFKPTVLSLLGQQSGVVVEGRDASELFRQGKAPQGWVDQTFVRIGGPEGGGSSWMGVFTRDYKLVLSPVDNPALFDLRTDPNELKNLIGDTVQRPLIRQLAGELKRYATASGDPLLQAPALVADLDWAISDESAYVAPVRPERPKQRKGDADE